MNKRLLAGVAAAGIIGGGVYGFAASIGDVDSSNLAAGGEDVAACDTDGVNVTYDVVYGTTGYKVSNINIAGINAACEGEDLSVTLSNEDNESLATIAKDDLSAAALAAADVDVPVVTVVLAEAVEGVDVVINGDQVVAAD